MLIVDKNSRLAKARAHSATHILHQVLNDFFPVKQHWSLVDEDYLRFDFYWNNITKQQIKEIEEKVNDIIRQWLELKIEYLPYEEALKTWAKAFFEDKYPEIVRIVSFGNYSKELCFWTHVENTSLIWIFKIISFESVASWVKRIVAYTWTKVLNYIFSIEERIEKIKDILWSSDIETKILKIINDNKEKEKRIDVLENYIIDFYLRYLNYVTKEPFERVYYIDIDIPLFKIYIKLKSSWITNFLLYNKEGYYIAYWKWLNEWKKNNSLKWWGDDNFIQGKDYKILDLYHKI